MNAYIERDTITVEQMKKWFDNNKNVLIFGDRGVGKTTIVSDFWDSLKLKYAFFSGATLDPWVDLIGIPKLVKKGDDSVIEFARPQTIDENLEAIFIDEYNRSPAAVRNAVLELIQFKSINGRKFPNLRVVWAAANPPDADINYDVEELDPAQEDRFHIIVKLSGKPNLDYFKNRYGVEVAKGAIKWHENLAPEIRKLISPRRLDYAIDFVINCAGEARDVLPDERINVSQFTRSIRGNSKLSELLNIRISGDKSKLKEFFKSQLNVQPCLKEIVRDYSLSNDFIKYGDTEEVVAFANSDEAFAILVCQESTKNKNIKQALDSYRQIHKENPPWFDFAHRTIISSKAALDGFVENCGIFTHSGIPLRVSDLSSTLNFKGVEEIIDEIHCMESASMYDMDEDSARNTLSFFSKTDLKDFCDKNKDADILKKAFSMIYSAFNFYYLRDANLIGASFDCKGCEKLVVVPPFSFQRGLNAKGTRGNNGRVSVKEVTI